MGQVAGTAVGGKMLSFPKALCGRHGALAGEQWVFGREWEGVGGSSEWRALWVACALLGA